MPQKTLAPVNKEAPAKPKGLKKVAKGKPSDDEESEREEEPEEEDPEEEEEEEVDFIPQGYKGPQLSQGEL